MPAPDDLQDGGFLGILAKEVRDLCTDVKEVKEEVTKVREDVAFIKGKIAGREIKEDRKFKIKSGIFLAMIATIFGLIGAFAAKLFNN